MPLLFANPADYDKIASGDELVFESVHESLEKGEFKIVNKTNNATIEAKMNLSPRQRKIIAIGGLLRFIAAGD